MADEPHELFLIDGNSLAYRAFFALPESIGTSDGRPTNAIYGLASMLVKIIDELDLANLTRFSLATLTPQEKQEVQAL